MLRPVNLSCKQNSRHGSVHFSIKSCTTDTFSWSVQISTRIAVRHSCLNFALSMQGKIWLFGVTTSGSPLLEKKGFKERERELSLISTLKQYNLLLTPKRLVIFETPSEIKDLYQVRKKRNFASQVAKKNMDKKRLQRSVLGKQ